MDYKFKVETIHDLSVHREYSKHYRWAQTSQKIMFLFFSLLEIWYITLFDSDWSLFVHLIYWVCYFICKKQGDASYRRTVTVNSGKPQHIIVFIGDEQVEIMNRDTQNRYTSRLSQVTSLIETQHLLILTMPDKRSLILQKYWINGGTSDDLKAYLLQQCTNIKKKKPRDTRMGKWLQWIHLAIMLLGTLLALMQLSDHFLLEKSTGSLHNGMSYQEIAAELEALDIFISPQSMEELEDLEIDYAPGAASTMMGYQASKVQDLLFWEGHGKYDPETWEWTPSTSGIYWFDAEVWNVESIYSDFLRGVSAMDETLTFNNVQEDYSRANLEMGTGMVSFSFDWMGTSYQLEADYDYDWFDTSILEQICSIVNGSGNDEKLYYAYDGGQGYYLYYGIPEQASRFEQLTGLYFTDDYFAFS